MAAPLRNHDQKHDVFQAIADPTRRKMLKLLAEQEMSVTVISRKFPVSRTAITKHLKVLSEAELVAKRKVGRESRYSIQAEPLRQVKDWLSFYESFWENKLSALKHFVEGEE